MDLRLGAEVELERAGCDARVGGFDFLGRLGEFRGSAVCENEQFRLMRRNDLCEVSTETAWGYASDQNGFSGDVGSERSGDFLGSGRGTKGWVGGD